MRYLPLVILAAVAAAWLLFLWHWALPWLWYAAQDVPCIPLRVIGLGLGFCVAVVVCVMLAGAASGWKGSK